jgi:rhodanese-related sulfurtransferase
MDKDTLPIELTATQAWQMLQDNPRAVMVDVRSSMEFMFVGHPVGATHIAWIEEPDWTINPNFVKEVRKLLLGGVVCDGMEGCAPVILICRSGMRSRDAGRALSEAGLGNVYSVAFGFEGELDEQHHRSTLNGWRFEGLPWAQC